METIVVLRKRANAALTLPSLVTLKYPCSFLALPFRSSRVFWDILWNRISLLRDHNEINWGFPVLLSHGSASGHFTLCCLLIVAYSVCTSVSGKCYFKLFVFNSRVVFTIQEKKRASHKLLSQTARHGRGKARYCNLNMVNECQWPN